MMTSCPHGSKSTPATCSQCLMAKPRVVTIVEGVVAVDGAPLGTLRQLNDQRIAEDAGIKRPVVRDDRTVFVAGGNAAARRRGTRNSAMRSRGANS